MNPYEVEDGGLGSCGCCGAEAVWVPEVKEGTALVPRALCGDCADEHVTLCAHCDHVIWVKDGVRLYASGNLYCSEGAAEHPAVAAYLDQSLRVDIVRDDIRRG